MKVHRSALKHAISETDGLYAAEHAVFAADLDEENPAREFRLGFDTAGSLLERVVLRFDSGGELLIHAMKARAEYYELLD